MIAELRCPEGWFNDAEANLDNLLSQLRSRLRSVRASALLDDVQLLLDTLVCCAVFEGTSGWRRSPRGEEVRTAQSHLGASGPSRRAGSNPAQCDRPRAPLNLPRPRNSHLLGYMMRLP
jgi:hypothetical protein